MKIPNTQIIYQPSGRAREYNDLAANLYAGCSHGCRYCYVPSAVRRQRDDFHVDPQPRKGVIAKLQSDCRALFGLDLPPIHLSFTTDPYQPCETEHRITRQAIQVIKRAGLNVEILTKGGLRATQDFDLLGNGDAVAASLTFLDAEKSADWEPNAAPPAERIEYLRQAKSQGLKTWVSLEPVIEPEETFALIRATHAFVDLYKVGPLNHHRAADEVNWAVFGAEVVSLFEELGCDYYLKEDLRERML